MTSSRTQSARSTIERLTPYLHAIGVSRVANVTDLDVCQLPVWTASRPTRLSDNIAVFSGKGFSHDDAEVGALMEAFERHCAETVSPPSRVFCVGENPNLDRWAHPRFLLPRRRSFDPMEKTEWVAGRSIFSDQTLWIPKEVVVYPYVERDECRAFLYNSTNGLASGNTQDEAILQALCEVIERDAISRFYARTTVRSQVLHLLGKSIDPVKAALASLVVAKDSLPSRVCEHIAQCESERMLVSILNITSDLEVPAFMCLIEDRDFFGSCAVHAGAGCHPDAGIALNRSLAEAAQTRLSIIQGAREDLPAIVAATKNTLLTRCHLLSMIDHDPHRQQSFTPTAEEPLNVLEQLARVKARLWGHEIREVAYVDLSCEQIPFFSAVRVVAPDLECWGMFHHHVRSCPVGRRFHECLHG